MDLQRKNDMNSLVASLNNMVRIYITLKLLSKIVPKYLFTNFYDVIVYGDVISMSKINN